MTQGRIFLKLGVDIEEYCDKNGVPEPIAYRLSLSFEEMTQQTISSTVGKKRIKVTIIYYGDSKNKFSFEVLKTMVSEISHYYDVEERLNTVRICI